MAKARGWRRRATAVKARTTEPVMAETAMPTQRRLAQAGAAFEIGGDARSGRVIRMLDSPLEQLLSERKLSEQHYEVLRRLRLHWYLGKIVGQVHAIDLNQVQTAWSGLAQNERALLHREAFDQGWSVLERLERGVVNAVVLTETGLTEAGAGLGYRSPYRGRVAALELLQSGAGRLVRAW